MPTDQRGETYENKAQGINSAGNHYYVRDYGSSASNPNTYHYSNKNGSYYYSNPNGSTYYCDGKGGATYTPPNSGSSDSGTSAKK